MAILPSAVEIFSAPRRTPIFFSPTPRKPPTPRITPSILSPEPTIRSLMVPMVWPSLLSDLDADQLLARQVLARRLALEEGVGRDRDLGGLLLGLLLLLRQGGHGKRGGEEESEMQICDMDIPFVEAIGSSLR